MTHYVKIYQNMIMWRLFTLEKESIAYEGSQVKYEQGWVLFKASWQEMDEDLSKLAF